MSNVDPLSVPILEALALNILQKSHNPPSPAVVYRWCVLMQEEATNLLRGFEKVEGLV
jgi:hypothetical protein